MSDQAPSALHVAIVTAFAFHEGYTVEPVTWDGEEGELTEGWQWRDPAGFAFWDREDGLISAGPVIPGDLFAELDASCTWKGISCS